MLCWRGARHAIECWIGPERLAETWWRRDEDAPVGEAVVTREYWRVRIESGWWVWIFRRVVEQGGEHDRVESGHAVGEASETADTADGGSADRVPVEAQDSSGTSDRRDFGDVGTVAAREASRGEKACPADDRAPAETRQPARPGRLDNIVHDRGCSHPSRDDGDRTTRGACRSEPHGDELRDAGARISVDRWFLHGVWS